MSGNSFIVACVQRTIRPNIKSNIKSRRYTRATGSGWEMGSGGGSIYLISRSGADSLAGKSTVLD